jgi:uncharacterized cofD-like protein
VKPLGTDPMVVSAGAPDPVLEMAAPAEIPVRAPRIVAVGGGTGLPTLLSGLKTAMFPTGRSRASGEARDRLTAIVTVADDGGSSGRLRRAFGVLAPGDIRNCLLALAECDPSVAALFGFRFAGDGGLGGHSLGNLILTALGRLEQDFPRAVARASEMLAVRGRVLPSTCDEVTLVAEFADGSCIVGESRIAAARRSIRRLRLVPAQVRALDEALAAIRAADLILLGPGSLYTSILPVLLVRDLADALAHAPGRVALVMNLMTEPGETDSYSAADCVRAIRRHAPGLPIHDVLLNSCEPPADALERYAAQGAAPIRPDLEALRALGCRPVLRDLLAAGPMIRHDPRELARAVLALAA